MKQLLCLLVMIFIAVTVFSQDIIVTKDSKRISATIKEVDVDVIKYLNYDNPTGPIYTLKKSDIATIIYQNGQVDVFNNNFQQNVVTNNQQLKKEDYFAVKRLRDAGISLSVIGTACIATGLLVGLLVDVPVVIFTCVPVGAVCLGAGIPCAIIGANKMRDYKYQQQLSYSVDFLKFDNKKLGVSFGGNSIGLSLKF